MAIKIATTVLNSTLNAIFNEAEVVFTCEIRNSGGSTIASGTIDFTNASNGQVQLVSSIFFAVSSGVTVASVVVTNNAIGTVLTEPITPETFTANGTFTINDIIVSLAT